MRERRIPLAALILNRVEPEFPAQWDGPADEESRSRLNQILQFYAALRLAQQVWIDRFEGLLEDLPTYRIPRHAGALHDLPALARLAELLVQ